MSYFDQQMLNFWRDQLRHYLALLEHVDLMISERHDEADTMVLVCAQMHFRETVARALSSMGGLGATW